MLIGIGLVVALVATAGLLTWSAVSGATARNAPEKIVDAYLSAVVDGRAEDALALIGGAPEGANTELLSDAVLAATPDRIAGYTLGRARISDGEAVVTATLEQAGEQYEQDFTLSRSGTDLLVVDRWALDAFDPAFVTVGTEGPVGSALVVNGVALTATAEELASRPLIALPGRYVFGAASADPLISVGEGLAQVGALSAEGNGGIARVQLTAELTPEGIAAGQAAADAYLDACLAQPVLAPVGCDFSAEAAGDETVTNIVWSIGQRPTFTIGALIDGGWAVDPLGAGTIYADGDYSLPSGEFGTVRYTLTNYLYAGVLDIVDGVMTFTFTGSNSSAGPLGSGT